MCIRDSAKGASVLKQLVSWVGHEQFFAGVRAYFARHSWGNTELCDLLVELERTSGRDLRAWSALWLERAGVTLLRPQMETDAHDIITAFEVLQEVPAEHPCLLYTSPSPRDRTRSRMPSSA